MMLVRVLSPRYIEATDWRGPGDRLFENSCFVLTVGGRGVGEVLLVVGVSGVPYVFLQLYVAQSIVVLHSTSHTVSSLAMVFSIIY